MVQRPSEAKGVVGRSDIAGEDPANEGEDEAHHSSDAGADKRGTGVGPVTHLDGSRIVGTPWTTSTLGITSLPPTIRAT